MSAPARWGRWWSLWCFVPLAPPLALYWLFTEALDWPHWCAGVCASGLTLLVYLHIVRILFTDTQLPRDDDTGAQ